MHLFGPGGSTSTPCMPTITSQHSSSNFRPSTTRLFLEGNLTVKHLDEEAVFFDMSKADPSAGKKDSPLPKRCFEACAFFTDCPHSVPQVATGGRVVLQYGVYESPASSQEDSQVPESLNELFYEFDQNPAQEQLPLTNEQPEMLLTEVRNLLQEFKGNRVGLPLFHRYCMGAVDTNILKEVDSRIYLALSKDSTLKVSCWSCDSRTDRAEVTIQK